ncbi:hypothetical protein B0H17DRAFT_1133445 [Mycena rosella]|uniref:Uncharacterized protein n=1 Tax=Mycena rosella TaxID=1033263 RepID=A0AAD7GKA2_MYCRO|nr:hypothetical protein B0H17DRAFT_1133445 [Mycena rosella]
MSGKGYMLVDERAVMEERCPREGVQYIGQSGGKKDEEDQTVEDDKDSVKRGSSFFRAADEDEKDPEGSGVEGKEESTGVSGAKVEEGEREGGRERGGMRKQTCVPAYPAARGKGEYACSAGMGAGTPPSRPTIPEDEGRGLRDDNRMGSSAKEPQRNEWRTKAAERGKRRGDRTGRRSKDEQKEEEVRGGDDRKGVRRGGGRKQRTDLGDGGG